MATPNGWTTPKLDWNPADGPTEIDLNRWEGNPNAIELGSRTVDPSQAPSSNTGTLRQFLSWILNRISAIIGLTNWYDTIPFTLQQAKTHADATGPHSSTSTATANRLMLRDAAGRCKVAAPSASDDVAIKQTVDDHANLTAPHSATSAATASRLILRDAAGRAQIADPSAAADIASKQYVDARAKWVVIADTTLGANAAQVEFTGLSNYKFMRLLVYAAAGQNSFQDTFVRFNSDSGANYRVNQSGGSSSFSVGILPATDAVSGRAWLMATVDIFNISATLFKMAKVHFYGMDSYSTWAANAQGRGIQWENFSSLISSMQIIPYSGTIRTGSRFILEGVV